MGTGMRWSQRKKELLTMSVKALLLDDAIWATVAEKKKDRRKPERPPFTQSNTAQC